MAGTLAEAGTARMPGASGCRRGSWVPPQLRPLSRLLAAVLRHCRDNRVSPARTDLEGLPTSTERSAPCLRRRHEARRAVAAPRRETSFIVACGGIRTFKALASPAG